MFARFKDVIFWRFNAPVDGILLFKNFVFIKLTKFDIFHERKQISIKLPIKDSFSHRDTTDVFGLDKKKTFFIKVQK